MAVTMVLITCSPNTFSTKSVKSEMRIAKKQKSGPKVSFVGLRTTVGIKQRLEFSDSKKPTRSLIPSADSE